MSKIKIIIADDQRVYRDGLKVVISDDDHLEVIAEADNGEDLMNILQAMTPDIILMDLHMPIMNGMEATKQVREKYPGIKILVVTMYGDDIFSNHLMENGANGYLLKNAEPEEIIRSIYSVL
jgi:DNA-binding NarL/FixJ family response regulator